MKSLVATLLVAALAATGKATPADELYAMAQATCAGKAMLSSNMLVTRK